MAWNCPMTCGKRLWFYSLSVIVSVVAAALLLIGSSVQKSYRTPGLRKFCEELGHVFLGSMIFSLIAVLYELLKDDEPEILNIIGDLNNASSNNERIYNDLSPTQTSRNTEVLRWMRENARHRALESIRLRALNTENGSGTTHQDQNYDQQVPQDSTIPAQVTEVAEPSTPRQYINNEDFSSSNSSLSSNELFEF